MTSTGISIKDVCNLIEKCRKFGVKSLKIGDIEVQFDSLGIEGSSYAGKPETWKQQEPVQELQMSEKDKKIIEQLHIAQDMIDDPGIYESTVIDKMLLEDLHGRDESR